MPVVAFRDGEFSPLSEMTVGIETTALHYGTNVFEGMRAYWNEDIEELYVFRAQDHFKRLHASASIYGMSLPYTVDELCAITQDLLTRNEVREARLHPADPFQVRREHRLLERGPVRQLRDLRQAIQDVHRWAEVLREPLATGGR